MVTGLNFVLTLMTAIMRGSGKTEESIHLIQQIFIEYFTCIPVLNTEVKEVNKMNNVFILIMGEESKQTIIEIEKYQ